jgi:hypothetical protein
LGIQGLLSEDSNPMKDALTTLKGKSLHLLFIILISTTLIFLGVLDKRGLKMSDLISICMYVSDMNDYAQYNTEYNEFFEFQPPVRVCVEAPLPNNVPILMEALAYSVQPGSDGSTRQCMYVFIFDITRIFDHNKTLNNFDVINKARSRYFPLGPCQHWPIQPGDLGTI